MLFQEGKSETRMTAGFFPNNGHQHTITKTLKVDK